MHVAVLRARAPRCGRKLYGPAVGPLTLERFAAEFAGWVHHYNTARAHQGLGGQTPLARWQHDATPIREIPAAELRFLLLAGQERTIGKSGIRFAGLHYIAPELHGRVGQQVQVRWLPHDPRRIEVFHAGRWLCTAKPQGALTAEERDQVLERRRTDAAELARRQRQASRAARARLAPITTPGPVTDTAVVTATRRRRSEPGVVTVSCAGWPGSACWAWTRSPSRPAARPGRPSRGRPARHPPRRRADGTPLPRP